MTRVFALVALAACAATSATAQPIPVTSDSRARYTALEIKPKPGGLVKVLTRRDGPSGIFFALREVDCDRRLFRYLGEGETRTKAAQGVARNRPGNTMGRLMEGSISTEVSDFACAVRH